MNVKIVLKEDGQMELVLPYQVIAKHAMKEDFPKNQVEQHYAKGALLDIVNQTKVNHFVFLVFQVNFKMLWGR